MGSSHDTFERFRNALRLVSVNAALAVLNESVPHRYTGVFELKGEKLEMRYVFDKETAPETGFLDVVPLQDSFCQIVLQEDGLRSDNTATDDRLNYSPYKGIVLAYHGVPIQSEGGLHSGTVCHFDVVDRHLGDEAYDCLRQCAALLPPYVLGRV